MKKAYQKPCMEMELYALDASIASNCGIVVSNGPAMGSHTQCSDYNEPFGQAGIQLYGGPYNVQFYEDTNCDCYTTGGDYGYWTS